MAVWEQEETIIATNATLPYAAVQIKDQVLQQTENGRMGICADEPERPRTPPPLSILAMCYGQIQHALQLASNRLMHAIASALDELSTNTCASMDKFTVFGF
jgi:hypothetical protein